MFRKLGLLGTFGLMVLCLCVFAGIGLYLKWFSFSASTTDTKQTDVHVSINKAKVQEDMNVVKEGAKHGATAVTEEFHSLLGEKTIKGTIHQIEPARQELTILDNKKQDVTIKVDTSTKIKIGDKDGSFSDLQADDSVTTLYEAKKDSNIAKTITVSKKS
jgi:hypothetical protein